ncbi:outer membrane protein assembly factor BamA [Marinomonas sp. 42_23_T18]|nr:outer membrane protein assembly factor BamA [Marinomonas sp. 42_23_T18]
MLLSLPAISKDISQVKIDGLLQVPSARALEMVGYEEGTPYDLESVHSSIQTLFASGFFRDIQVFDDDGVLTFQVQERPSIGLLTIEGNDLIATEDLEKGLTRSSLEVGEFYKPDTLNQIEQELQRQYYALGRYNADVEVITEEMPRNRIGVTIKIVEGETAKIVHLNVIGNELFSESEITKNFLSMETGYFNPFGTGDEYAKPKIQADLDSLKSYYLDRGFLDYELVSSQVSLSQNKQDVYIVINIEEGPQYTINEVLLNGELVLDESDIFDKVTQEKGDIFSRAIATKNLESISALLGDQGYLFTKVNIIPEKLADNKVNLTYHITPGPKVYIRRINFSGNSETRDEVLRRQMTQFEGSLANHSSIQQSKRRIERLGYFGEVTLRTVPVKGSSDLVDIDIKVQEQPSGSIQASIGYSDGDGVQLGFGISKRNFLGTGNKASFNISSSATSKKYTLSYDNPFFTVDGISRGFDVFYKTTDYDDDDEVEDYSLDTLGATVRFGYPISDTQRLTFGMTAKETKVKLGTDPSNETSDYVESNGNNFDDFIGSITWSDSDLVGGMLPTQGYSTRLSLSLATPISDQEYGKLDLNSQRYWNLNGSNLWLVRLKGKLGYGFGYGDSEQLPFYENYYAGGVYSVRGFDSSSLGPLNSYPSTSDEDPSALGGNISITGTAEFIFPMPMVDDHKSVRTAFFIDAGNVFTDNCYSGNDSCKEGVDFAEIRFSAGFSWTWVTPIAPLSFNLARALNAKTGDDTDVFQFQLGTTF